MRNVKNITHIDISRRGSVIIKYIAKTNGNVIDQRQVYGIAGCRLNIKHYTSNNVINQLIAIDRSNVQTTYIFDDVTTTSVRFSFKPSMVLIYIKPVSNHELIKHIKQHKPYKHTSSNITSDASKTVITLNYICNHQKLIKSVEVPGLIGRLISIRPYTSNAYINHKLLPENKSIYYQYDRIGHCPKRFTKRKQSVSIYVSTLFKKKDNYVSTSLETGKVVILYKYIGTHQSKQVISKGKIGQQFMMKPYFNEFETNHGMRIDGIYGLFKPIKLVGKVQQYTKKTQHLIIYAEEHSLEISMSLPQIIIESLERYIKYGSRPYFADSGGPIDINRSGLIRYLMSAYGNQPVSTAFLIMKQIFGQNSNNRYITLKTTNTHILRHKGNRVSRLFFAMVNGRVPIMSFKHDKHGNIRHDAKGKPIVKHVYYPVNNKK